MRRESGHERGQGREKGQGRERGQAKHDREKNTTETRQGKKDTETDLETGRIRKHRTAIRQVIDLIDADHGRDHIDIDRVTDHIDPTDLLLTYLRPSTRWEHGPSIKALHWILRCAMVAISCQVYPIFFGSDSTSRRQLFLGRPLSLGIPCPTDRVIENWNRTS